MACNFIDSFQDFASHRPAYSTDSQGILDVHCGCMVSKWTAIEFKKVYGIEKVFLQVSIVYIEPFHAYDNFTFYLAWDKVPFNLMQAYNKAYAQTIFEIQDGMVSMIVPYLYKNRKTLMKRFKTSVYETGDIEVLEGVHIESKKDLSKINNIFNM